MNIDELKNILIHKLNFSPAHAEVYAYMLKNVKATVTDIVQNTKIARTTVYESLRYFDKKNLLTSLGGRNKTYVIESPEQLEQLIEQENIERKHAARKLVSTVSDADLKKRPPVNFHQGVEGVKKVRNDVLNSRSNIVHTIYNWDYIEEYLNKTSSFQGVREEKSEFKFKDEQIYTSSKGDIKKPDSKNSKLYFTKEDIGAEITIFDDNKIVFIDYKNEDNKIQTIKIENRNIAKTMTALFNMAKKFLTK